jgi:hypothetical protein
VVLLGTAALIVGSANETVTSLGPPISTIVNAC